MSLTNKVSVAVFEVRPYEMENNLTGEKYQGYSCKAFKKDNTVIKFSSPTPVKANDIGEYDPAVAVDLTLFGREFHGDLKWSTERPKEKPAK